MDRGSTWRERLRRRAWRLSAAGLAVVGAAVCYAEVTTEITTVAGDGTSQTLDPYSVALASDGTLFIADTNNGKIQKATLRSDGTYDVLSTVRSGLGSPRDLTLDSSGDILFAQGGANGAARRVSKLTANGNTLTTVVGNGDRTVLEDVNGIALDGSGNLFIADKGNNRVRRAALLSNGSYGALTTVLTGVRAPRDVAVASNGDLYVAATGDNRVVRASPQSGGGYGTPTVVANLGAPYNLAFDGDGALLVAVSREHRVVRISGSTVTTVAGTGVAGFSGDGGSATAAQLRSPTAIIEDSNGDVFIVDRGNKRVRRVQSNTTPVADAGSDATIEATSATATQVTLDGSGSSDDDGDMLTYSWAWTGGSATGEAPTVSLPLGTTDITLTVSDGMGGSSTDEVSIDVVDTTAPSISVRSLTPEQLWPADGQLRRIRYTLDVSDAVTASPTVTVTAVSDQASSSRRGGGGSDIRIGADGSVRLRAERTRGRTRTYTLTFTATDEAGNEAETTATVTVERPRRSRGGRGR